jgi:oligoendopeptidase F
MNRIVRTVFYVAVLIFAGSLYAGEDPVSADSAHTWDLSEIYASPEAWEEARQQVMAECETILARRGTLDDSAAALFEALDLVSDTTRKAWRVSVYANLQADEDLRVTATQERKQLAQVMDTRLNEATAWMQPEILRVGAETVQSFIREDSRLSRFAHELDDMLRNAPYTLGEEAEQTLAYLTPAFDVPGTIYGITANSDIPWPTVRLSDGEEGVIDSQGYVRYRGSADRADRKLVFDAFWGKWLEYRNSVGAILNSHVQTQAALARARRFESVLQRELFQDNLPPAVYRTLVAEVNAALPTLHRYFRLRGRMLGIDQLRYYDMYPPLVSLDKEFDFETSKRITLDAMAVLGEDWVNMQRDAMSQRWMHVYPQRGKQMGAYVQAGAYDVHPYMLLNHTDDYNSLTTMAHEWGHAMHSLYAKQAQPFDTAFYATFIAEIPSTSLELILQDHMKRIASSDEERLFYLGSALETFRLNFFRQTMFAEFELALYEAAERGDALSGERISEMYGEILRRYHGHDEGVLLIDDLYTNEWMFIPHFYFNMYVFQYATSQTAGTALYAKIVEEGEPGVENYKNLLSAGSSGYPFDLLSRAGVDLTQPEPYRAVVAKMNAIMDEIEGLLDRRGP